MSQVPALIFYIFVTKTVVSEPVASVALRIYTNARPQALPQASWARIWVLVTSWEICKQVGLEKQCYRLSLSILNTSPGCIFVFPLDFTDEETEAREVDPAVEAQI